MRNAARNGVRALPGLLKNAKRPRLKAATKINATTDGTDFTDKEKRLERMGKRKGEGKNMGAKI
jgi:hypothetical protein